MSYEYLPRNVKKENEQQYGLWPLSADARRALYLKYGATPDERREGIAARDIWAETAQRLDGAAGGRIVDIGASSGYFIEQLLQPERGHAGRTEIIGVDKAAAFYPVLEDFLRNRYGHQQLHLIEGDAEKLSMIESNSVTAASALFLAYHLPRPHRLFSEMSRIVKPGGLKIISSRGEDNLANLWQWAKDTAEAYDAVMPKFNFYHHFPAWQLVESLTKSKRTEVVDIIEQNDYIYIPADEEGWMYAKDGILSYLGIMRRRRDNGQLRYGDVNPFVETVIKNEFMNFGRVNGGYVTDRMHQVVVTAVNKKTK